MPILQDRWPGLRALPRAALGDLPTPVVRLDAVSAALDADVWCKRDDLTHRRYGGNKVRKLEYLIGEATARGSKAIVTAGAAGSHHVLATALFARDKGLEVHAVLSPQPWSQHVEDNLRADLGAGAVVYPVASFAAVGLTMLGLATKLRLLRKKPYIVVPGGSSPTGCVGYVEAGLELASQIEEGTLPEPDAVYIALGTGGTAAGAAIGLAAAGIMAEVVAVRVTDPIVSSGPVLHTLVRRTVRRLQRVDNRFPEVTKIALDNLRIDAGELGPGYGEATESSSEAVELWHGRAAIELDGTYTAKAAAALVREARGARRGKRLLYWHTLSSAELAPLLRAAPGLRGDVAALMRKRPSERAETEP